MVPPKSGNLPSTSATPTKVTVNPIFEWPESTGNFSAAKPEVATNTSNEPIVRRRSINNLLFQNARILPPFFSLTICASYTYRSTDNEKNPPIARFREEVVAEPDSYLRPGSDLQATLS